jgi:alpha-L-fucosidase
MARPFVLPAAGENAMRYAWVLLLIAVFVSSSNAEEPAGVKQPQEAAAAKAIASPAVESHAASQRRLQWFHEAKYGLFVHWGLWAIPAGEWKGRKTSTDPCFVSMEAGIPLQEYHALARQFNPTKFDAEAWARLAVDAGMKYIIYVAKHSDGFAMYRSKVSSFNIYDATPWKRDPLAELRVACDRHGIKLCVYYSQAVDADDPGGVNVVIRDQFPTFSMRGEAAFDRYLRTKSLPQLEELLTQYGKLGLIWFDVPMGMIPERTRPFIDTVRRLQPNTLISTRVGDGPSDYDSMGDNEAPVNASTRAWEMPGTLNWSWGYRKSDNEWKSPRTVCFNLVDIVSKGGNYALNVGPKADGTFPEAAQDILRKVGVWLKQNGQAIYGAGRTPFGAEFGQPTLMTVEDNRRVPTSSGRDWRCTTKPGKLYVHVFRRPADGKQIVPMTNAVTRAVVLGDPSASPLAVRQTPAGLQITLPKRLDPLATVIELDVQGAVKKVAK